MSDQLVAVSVGDVREINSNLFLLILEYQRMIGFLSIISGADLELGETI